MKNKIPQKTIRTLKIASILGALLLLSIAFTVYSEVSDFVINWWSVDGGEDTWEIAKNILLDTVSTCHENWIIRIEYLI